MKTFEPAEAQIAHRRFLQWRYGEDTIQKLKEAGIEINIAALRQELLASITATGLTQMQHEDAAALLGISDLQNLEEHILQADGVVLCAILWATGKEALLP